MPAHLIKVPERGETELHKSVGAKLTSDPRFWTLVDRNILSVEHSTPTTISLKGSCFVGRATIGEITIEIEEKIVGSVNALLGHASKADFRIQKLPSETSAIGPLISLLADQFSGAVERYLARGREFGYKRERRVGALIGGKLDLTGTTKLRARGLRHLAQFEKSVLSFDTTANLVIFAALRELERINRLIRLDPSTLVRTRALATLFSDCRTSETLFGARVGLIRLAAKAQELAADTFLDDALSLASVILMHESFEPIRSPDNHSPRSWFLNLETLFETAVRNVLCRHVGKIGTVQHGRTNAVRVFPLIANQYRAQPDLVIRVPSSPCVIGDAKYKVPQLATGPADIYQLLVHASAFGAQEAFLVYPDQAFTVSDLGTSVTGTRVRLFTLDVRDLPKSLKQLLAAVLPGVIPAPAIEETA